MDMSTVSSTLNTSEIRYCVGKTKLKWIVSKGKFLAGLKLNASHLRSGSFRNLTGKAPFYPGAYYFDELRSRKSEMG